MGPRPTLTALVLAVMAFPFLVLPGHAASPSIATVDMARVLREYDEVKRVAEDLQRRKDEYQEEIDRMQNEIKRINDEIQDKDIAADQKSSKEKLRRKKLAELQNKFQVLKEKLGEMEKRAFDRIRERIFKEIDKVVADKGVSMVFERQWLYHPRDTIDITDELLSALEAQAKTGGKVPARKGARKATTTRDEGEGATEE